MTQHCPYDDKLLDALYGELSAEEEAAFSAHLPGCVQCRATQERIGRVRAAFRALPAPALEEDILERMTARILQQAQPPPRERAPIETLGSTRDLPSAEVGKLLPFRRRGLRRILFHPAAGIVAAAAMALIFVVARGWDQGPIFPMADRLPPPPRLSRAPGAAPGSMARGEASREPPGPVWSGVGEDRVASPALRREAAGQRTAMPPEPSPGRTRSSAVARENEKKKTAWSETDRLVEDVPGASWPGGQTPSKEAGSPGGLVGNGLAPRTGEAMAPAARARLHPPPPPEGEEVPAASEEAEGRQARPLRALASSAPTPTRGTRPAQHQQVSPEVVEADEALQQNLGVARRSDLHRAVGRLGAESGQTPADSQMQQLLRRLRDHLQQGQCREAAELQRQIAQLHQAFEIPPEDRATMARICPTGQNAIDPELAARQQIDRRAPANQSPKKGTAPARVRSAVSY